MNSNEQKLDAARPHPHHPTILIVDDEPDLLRMFERRLRRSRFNVLTTSSVQTALQLLDRYPISAVVVDVRLRGISGWVLVEAVRRWRRGVSVVVLSGFPSACLKARELGLPCVAKGDPWSFRELLAILRTCVGAGAHD